MEPTSGEDPIDVQRPRPLTTDGPASDSSSGLGLGSLADILRRHEAMWYPGGRFDATVQCGEMVCVALQVGARSVQALRHGAWWVVVSPDDWLDEPSGDLPTVFQASVPIPGEQNSMRPESWLVAFATDVVTVGPTGATQTVQGEANGVENYLRRTHVGAGRIVAFRR